MAKLAYLIAQLSIIGARKERERTTRRFLLMCARMLRKDPEESIKIANDLNELEAHARTTHQRWTDTLADEGEFDGSDLRIWLQLAEEASVPFIPARTILSLDEDTLDRLSEPVAMPQFMRKGLAKLLLSVFGAPQTGPEHEHSQGDEEGLREKLFEAMDDVPDNWIIRSHICGPELLKAWAGTGLLEPDTTMKVNQDLEVGPGWVRHGNRRRVDATDERYITLFPGAHGPVIHYLARPWVEASRRCEGEDPHRHGSVFAGKGSWPCEWRVFFEQDVVTGVAFYYGWAGKADAENARKAFEAKRSAEKIIAAGKRRRMQPRMMDIEIIKWHLQQGATPSPKALQAVTRFGDGFCGTLDFVETNQGMTLLEGGPGHTPVGGGHPCAFAGTTDGGQSQAQGVALKLMAHISLAEPGTWTDGDRNGHILTWNEARTLASYSGECAVR